MKTETTPVTHDTTDWKTIALALAQRVNFAMTNLDSKGGGMLNTETMQVTPWRDYLAEAMEMIPGVVVDREILATLYLPQAKRRKAQAEIRARRAAKVLDSIAPTPTA